jgi:tRNA-dihydrouridine synthase
MLSEEGNERRSVLTMRKFFGWYSRGIHGGTRFRQEVFRAETVEDVKHVVNTFLEGLERMEMIDHTHSAMVES